MPPRGKPKRRTKPYGRHKPGEPWEPSPEQLEIHKEFSLEHKPQRDIAKEHKISQAAVSGICSKVSVWLSHKYLNETIDLKRDSMAKLEAIFRSAIHEFSKNGKVSYLKAAMEAIDKQLKIGGGYAPIELDHHVDGDIRAGGKTTIEVIGQFQTKLDALKEKQKLIESKREAGDADSNGRGRDSKA
jgi:DNA invertase Pin-like site-specific DNA recombinase